ncbi:2-amino-4,5-dihydroxy-6-oxo-7-(phosphonooxy)heptanoate synthase [Kutzneria viridogrisea]|uniref:2-amino-4, 5-dihydroxy-6-oxo-7-(Phosphonooxy)heptanoate synthase n=1 Tax=Kutzneria viridogrisea TaxID=47990 RepID=A0ABR6BJF3_9PSEU|nr:2-amino-3,7-dideoxy-D-threo-hept-6-ulosonate synthase [Kutzneria albida]MBA8927019.1 2-amino-4,5-dihydroxy-6-oxo-7-(phosphonooxy)heptanoate synthase [Kutzneria viridogrisea]
MADTGKALRLRRLSRAGDGRYLFVPLDHSVSDGPVAGNEDWDELIRDLVLGGADAIIVHKGRIRAISPELLEDCALVVHLSAGTVHAADAHAKVLVGDVEDALRLGADAVSVHVNVGSDTEARQLADLGAVASSCQEWNVPLIAMAYARGPRVRDSHDPEVLAHVVNIAADLGADLVKTSMALPVDRMAEVTASCPIPVLAAGGPPAQADPDGSGLAEYARAALDVGCAGLAIGRRVFSAPNPLSLVHRLAAVLHPDAVANHPSMTTGAGAA